MKLLRYTIDENECFERIEAAEEAIIVGHNYQCLLRLERAVVEISALEIIDVMTALNIGRSPSLIDSIKFRAGDDGTDDAMTTFVNSMLTDEAMNELSAIIEEGRSRFGLYRCSSGKKQRKRLIREAVQFVGERLDVDVRVFSSCVVNLWNNVGRLGPLNNKRQTNDLQP